MGIAKPIAGKLQRFDRRRFPQASVATFCLAFLPDDWAGKAGQPPYPPYGIDYLGEQDFRQPNDLVREQTFAGQTFAP